MVIIVVVLVVLILIMIIIVVLGSKYIMYLFLLNEFNNVLGYISMFYVIYKCFVNFEMFL